ncbi:MAG: hypothetical protein M1824_003091 [Vezdaea acicularis]|nr:MAG: hypothetical protein M1824_003091 [Vezdaea acicularis]
MAAPQPRGTSPKRSELAHQLSALGVSSLPSSPTAHPNLNPVDIYRLHLTELLTKVTGVEWGIVYNALSWTQTLDKGDLVLPVPALRVKGKKPVELAKEWAANFPESPLVEKPVVATTFLQFFFKPKQLAELVIQMILTQGEKFGLNPHNGMKDPSDPSKGRKRVIVEFSSPNIAKQFHAGHLRSTIIGGFLSNLYEGAGWDVIRMNYLGDWGRQFGLLANGFLKFGDEAKFEEDPIGHLYDVYVQINKISEPEQEEIKKKREAGEDVTELENKSQNGLARDYFKRMEDGDEKALGLWKRFRDLSIEKYKQTYARLNIKYDEYSGESMVKPESIAAAARLMEESGVSEESQGAVIVNLEKHSKKLGKAVVRKKDGTSLYLTRDIAAATERYDKYHFDKMIYVVASQQDLHLAQLFKILELMGHKEIADKCTHITFGMVQGMSTRKGTVKFLDDILKEVAEKMHDVMRMNQAKYEQVAKPEEVADTLGISSVMVQDMAGKRVNGYKFDIDRMTSFEGDTGPYLQYAHARLCSITRKAGIPREELFTADLSLLKEPYAVDLVRVLAQWPDIINQTLKTLEPVTVLTYLFKMTHMLSSSYDHLWIVGKERELGKARLALYESARQVLRNGMVMLGLNPVERM